MCAVRDIEMMTSYLARVARATTRQRADADDLVQDTCCRALEAAAQFTEGTNLRAWLRCIMRNAHRDRIRHASRERVYLNLGENLPAKQPEDLSLWRLVRDEDLAEAIESVPRAYRAAHTMYAVQGFSYLEVSKRLGIPPKTVGVQIWRARQWMRAFLVERLESAKVGVTCPRLWMSGKGVAHNSPGRAPRNERRASHA
jgi:RNA polymerase sigma-70 factor (ECF subfamily)